MSIVIACKNPQTNNIIIGTDSQLTYPDGSKQGLNGVGPDRIKNFSKLVHQSIPVTDDIGNVLYHLPVLFGTTGAINVNCVLPIMKFPSINENNLANNFSSYIFCEISQMLIESSQKFLFWDDNTNAMSNEFLFIANNSIFKIEESGSVLEFENFAAVGSGRCFAMGGILSGWNFGGDNRAELGCYLGMEAAKTFDLFCSGESEYFIYDTENGAFETYDVPEYIRSLSL